MFIGAEYPSDLGKLNCQSPFHRKEKWSMEKLRCLLRIVSFSFLYCMCVSTHCTHKCRNIHTKACCVAVRNTGTYMLGHVCAVLTNAGTYMLERVCTALTNAEMYMLWGVCAAALRNAETYMLGRVSLYSQMQERTW